MSADSLLLNKHLEEAEFLSGAHKGMWGVVDYDLQHPSWPKMIFWIQAKQKNNCPDRYYFQFDLNGYPETAPTACPWDVAKNEKLDFNSWPKGGTRTSSVFKTTWDNGNSLYSPCDRVAVAGHPNWATDHPNWWWSSQFTIVKYLRFIHELLNSSDYAN